VERDQLAAAMDANPGGGTFIIKIAAAKLFGLIEVSSGKFQLTSVGFEILDPSRVAAAKVAAFLSVPLYKRMYEDFKGRQLPPRPAGLENAFVQLGVSAKQKDKARHAFDKSARSAGFFPNSAEDRLVAPITGGVVPPVNLERQDAIIQLESPAPTTSKVGQVTNYVPEPTPLNPFVEGLLKKLPEEGTEWTLEARKRWLEAASHIFNLVYEGNESNRFIEIDIAEI
jgi:hypothetical protein